MHTSSPNLPRSRWLASAGLVSALALFFLGASIPRLAAQTYNFNDQSDAAWTHYDLSTGGGGYYPPNIYSFPTNAAGPAGNYAYRMQIPVYTNDPNYYLYPRGGSFLTGASYGNINDSTYGRFKVAADLIAWNNNWPDMEIGLCWDAGVPNLQTVSSYLAGWGPGEKTLGIAVIINSTAVGLIGLGEPGSSVLQTNHQYRMVSSSHDGQTFLVQLFDLAQPNSPWQSAISIDNSLGDAGDGVHGGGTVGILGADFLQIKPSNSEGADATWDNFSASAPAFVDPSSTTTPATMPATLTDLTPPPAGQAVSPVVSIGFLNRDTGVNTVNNPSGWVKLYMDGVQIPNSQLTIDPNYVWKLHNNDAGQDPNYQGPHFPYPTNFGGATVSWIITNRLVWGSMHTNTVVFQDDQVVNGQNVLHTNTWSWTVGFVSRFADSGALSVRGFDARLVRSSAANIAASDVNLVANGDFSANAAEFTTWPGYCGGSNPGSIPGWDNSSATGINGAGTGPAVDTPFGPTTSAGYTFLFLQGGGVSQGQNLAGLTANSSYQLTYDACSRAGNTGVWQVVVASDYSGSPASILYDSGAVAGNTSSFHHNIGYFSLGTLTGNENIQLKNVTGAGDNTVDFANVAITPTNYATLPNGVVSAKAVLNYQYAVDLAATNWDQVIAFGLAGTENGAVSNFPGLCVMPAGGATPQGNSFAVEALAYLQLPAGTNTFLLQSDDYAAVYTGTNLTDTSTLLAQTAASTNSFTWDVAQAGLYPVHIIYEQGGGSAYLVLSSVNPTANTTNLVNAAGSTVQAFYPLVCLSSTAAKGPFSLDATANAGHVLRTAAAHCENGTGTSTSLTVTGGTMTFPLPTAPKDYRLDSPRPTKITSIQKVGTNLVINYNAY